MIQPTRYSLDVIRTQVHYLVRENVISYQQPIYTLCQYIPVSEWVDVERELEEHNFLLKDRIADLINYEEWENE